MAKCADSVHDASILRESDLFKAFESDQKPFDGVLLGDSSYMLRDWLITPILNPRNAHEDAYTNAHSATRSTIERCNQPCAEDEMALSPR